jgi:hypothetical protein
VDDSPTCRKGPENGLEIRVVPADRALRAIRTAAANANRDPCGKRPAENRGPESGASAVGLHKAFDDLAEICVVLGQALYFFDRVHDGRMVLVVEQAPDLGI